MSDPLGLTSVTPNSPTVDPPAVPVTDPSNVRDLAAQFEGLLMSQMMKEMKLSFGGSDDEDGDSGGQSMAPLGDAMMAELGLALSRAGGFGLGDVLARAIAKNDGSTTSATAASPAATAPTADDEAPVAVAPPTAAPAVVAAPVAAPAAATVPAATTPNAPISSPFGWRADPITGETRFHKGMDVAIAQGSAVYAPAAGQVQSVGEEPGYGLTVVVQHANGYQSRYAHLSSINVRAGQTVSAGAVLAQSGNTGRSTGAHLHLEVLANGQAVNPENWVDAVVSGPAATRQQP